MNFLGHIAVTTDAFDDIEAVESVEAVEVVKRGRALGAALPDLAAMAGVRFVRSELPEAVGRGVGDHHRADRAFHAHPAFRQGATGLRQGLLAQGLETGPSRAVAHAGWELLLDGCLTNDPVFVAWAVQVLAGAGALADHFDEPSARGRWERLCRHLADDVWWLGYRDPAFVAQRLYRRLAGRRRLQFGPEWTPTVAQGLAEAQPGVRASYEAVVTATVAALGPPPAGRDAAVVGIGGS